MSGLSLSSLQHVYRYVFRCQPSSNLIIITQDPAKACQSFSSSLRPSCLRAIPTLEQMITTWDQRIHLAKYAPVKAGLEKGVKNLQKWYRNTDDTDIYFMNILLDPRFKLAYFQAKWESRYVDDARKKLDKVVRV